MDNDPNDNGRSSKGILFPLRTLLIHSGSRQKSNGRSKSVTNPESITTQSLTSSSTSSPTLTRIVSAPIPTTTAPPPSRAQPKPRRGLFSILAAAAQSPPTPPKSETSSNESNASSDTPPAPQPPPSFMQSLARRLSGSSIKKPLVEAKNTAPQCPRRTLNINYVRPRPEIKELEKIQLRRVCFVADEYLISKRVFKASEPFETELPREAKLKVRDLREVYYRSSMDREVTPDDRVATAFSLANGIELRKLDLSNIKFLSRDSVLPICDTLSLARGLEEVMLDYCELTDEQLRLFLAALLCLKPQQSESEIEHGRGVARLSLAGNNTLSLAGWRTLAYFVHMVYSLRVCAYLECGPHVVEYILHPNVNGSCANSCKGDCAAESHSTRNTPRVQTSTYSTEATTTKVFLPAWKFRKYWRRSHQSNNEATQ